MFLMPKALLRVKARPARRSPASRATTSALSKMIDAPLGDRTQWKPQLARRSRSSSSRSARREIAREGARRHGGQLRPHVPLCARGRRRAARSEGIDAEVIDLRSLFPYDWDAIKASVQKTGRVLFVNEDTEVTNFGEHLIRRIVEELFYELHAPPKLLAGAHVPGIGLADHLERASVPQKDSDQGRDRRARRARALAFATVSRSDWRKSTSPRGNTLKPRPTVEVESA